MPYTDVQCNLKPVNTCNLLVSENVRPDCCHVYDPIPPDAGCFLPDICKGLQRLYNRHNRMFVKRPRLMEMALPLRRRCRFVPKCTCQFEKTIQIVPADSPMYTRTEQLALPSVRRLRSRLALAVRNGDLIGESVLTRFLRYSLLSLYSRLANITPVKPRPKKKKMGPKAKRKHKLYVEKLAKPKKVLKPPRIARKAGEIDERRLKKLAKPRIKIVEVKPKWELSENMRTYRPTKRIKEISKPVERENVHIAEAPFTVAHNALKYKATQRVRELAQPAAMRERKVDADLKEDPFGVSPNALKYKASSRIKELSEPREFENAHIRENPFSISPAALKAKASPRTIELAKPKGG